MHHHVVRITSSKEPKNQAAWEKVKRELTPEKQEFEDGNLVAGQTSRGDKVDYLTFETKDLCDILPPGTSIVAVPRSVFGDACHLGGASCMVWPTDRQVDVAKPSDFIADVVSEMMVGRMGHP